MEDGIMKIQQTRWPNPVDRRPIGLRDQIVVRAIAAWLVRVGVKPNQVSVLGVGFSALSATCLLIAPTAEPAWGGILLIGAATFIAFRGLCNLCDGLMAIEGGLRTRSGEIFNDLPDRVSDVLVLVAAGYAVPVVGWGRELGWLAGLLAALTAYVRVLGAAAGAAQQFGGPMAKPQRMIVLGAACLAGAVESAAGQPAYALAGGLVVVAVGSAITIVRRAARIVRELEA
jgi:phosphatidylglycerophosphate synthase